MLTFACETNLLLMEKTPYHPALESFCWLAVCLDGKADVALTDGTCYPLTGGYGLLKPAGTGVLRVDRSADYQCRSLILSSDYVSEDIKLDARICLDHPLLTPMQAVDTERLLRDLDEVESRLAQPFHNYYADVVRRAVETVVTDFIDIHARRAGQAVEGVNHATRLLQRFVSLLQEGLYKKERSVEYYATRLSITPKYLSEACIDASGHHATFWIDHFTRQEIERQMSDTSKPLADIAAELNFSTASYFSRYVKKLFGCSPSEFREQQMQ